MRLSILLTVTALSACFAAPAASGEAAHSSAFRGCGSFSHNGKTIGVSSDNVGCSTARRVAKRKVAGRYALGFKCYRKAFQPPVRTYTCKKAGGKRVYIFNGAYESE
jgi:hypothetical protein